MLSPGMLAWVYVGLITVVAMVLLFYILRTIFKHKMIARRLESLAEDVHAFGRSSLIKELQRCDFCRRTSHVHLWRYGNADVTHETLICYLCVSRIQKLLDPPTTYKGVRPHAINYVQRDGQPTYRSRGRQTLTGR